MENAALTEYTVLRQEINTRALLLHLLLGVGSVLLFAGTAVAFWLYNQSHDLDLVQNFLLTLPIIFSCLTFGYQANQWTLERLAGYLRNHSPVKDLASGWENYYINAKRTSELLSFLKVLPLLLPQLLPLVLMWWNWNVPTGPLNNILTGIDLTFFALVIFTFRFKILHRIKL